MSIPVLRTLLACALVLSFSSGAHAQLKTAPTADSLEGITRRGRLLAGYDAAAWIASDSLMGRRPDAGTLTGYVARLVDRRWTVAFGRMTPARDTFYVAYEVIEAIPQTRRFDVVPVVPPRPDTDYYLRASRAVDSARRDFGQRHRPTRAYNSAVIEQPDGSLYVYMTPAQTQLGVYPVGADVRYHFSPDGLTLIAKRQMHNAIIEFSHPPRQDNSTLQAGVTTAILDDIPEDTDVFHVLVRQPRVPQYVMSKEFFYRIQIDGRIELYGRTDEVLNRKDSPIQRKL